MREASTKHFGGETEPFIYMFKIPFSGNPEFIDLVFSKTHSKQNMSAILMKGSYLHPRPNHTKDALYSKEDGEKKANTILVLGQ